MDRSTELRTPTVAVAVDLALGPYQLVRQRGELHVPGPATSPLIEALGEVLDAPTDFVPFHTSAGVVLVSKAAIVYVSLRDAEAETTLYDRQHRVAIVLAQGTRFEGLLLDSSPADHPRVTDHLNHAARFVRLWTPEEHVLIHKTQIVTVTELPEVG